MVAHERLTSSLDLDETIVKRVVGYRCEAVEREPLPTAIAKSHGAELNEQLLEVDLATHGAMWSDTNNVARGWTAPVGYQTASLTATGWTRIVNSTGIDIGVDGAKMIAHVKSN